MTWSKGLEFQPHKEIDHNNKVEGLMVAKITSFIKKVFIDGGDSDYKNLAQRVAQQVFHINGNITSIERLVGFLGMARDTPDIRNKL